MFSKGTWLFLGKYCGGGLLSYVTPRLLVAAGVPLDQWIVVVGGWLSIHVDRELALWAATFFIGAALYGGSIILSKDHDWRPQIPGAAKRLWKRVEPTHLIALGLGVAFVGLIWQWRRGPPPDPRVAMLESRIKDLERQLTSDKKTIAAIPSAVSSAPSPTVPAAATQGTSALTYTERDIRELLNGLSKAQDLDRDKIFPTIVQIETTAANWSGIYRNQNLVGKLKELRTRLKTDVWDAIDELVYDNHEKNSMYVEQMRMAFVLDDEAAKDELTRAFQPAIDAIGKLPPNPSEDTLQLIAPQFAELRKQSSLAYQWYIKLHARIPEMMANLRTKGITGYEKK